MSATSDTDAKHQIVRRRSALVLPRVWPHLLGAAGLVLAAWIGLPAAAMMHGDAGASRPGGSLALPIPEPLLAERPLDATGELPDLLAADVLIGDNPTQGLGQAEPQTDALGNPVSAAPPAPQPKTITLPAAPPPAPLDPSLTRSSEFGPLPRRNADGLSPLRAYGTRARVAPGTQPVSVIVGGLGINDTLTQRAIDELPAAVTLSFAAHAPDLQRWVDAARRRGHEVLLELPMESAGFDPAEPGAGRALRVGADVATNRDNLYRLLSRAQGYAGVINYNGDRLLTRSDVVAPLLAELEQSGLGFIADGSFATPTLSALAQSTDLPFVRAFGLIDPSADRATIDARLDALSSAAQDGGGTIGVGFAYPQTIDALKGWTATLRNDGLTLVPATQALQ